MAELLDLKTRGRADMSKQIAEAVDKGDLSENAEYDAAKDAQGHLEAKISQLEVTMGNAKVIDESQMDKSRVGILATVTICNLANKMEVEYTLVAEEESDLAKKRISVKSPIGKSLLGKKVGDVVEVAAPAGKIEFEIIGLKY